MWSNYPTIIHRRFQLVLRALIIALSIILPMVASAAGPVVQLLWSTQPGSATEGSPFGQQPTLITADAQGNPSTIGLAATVNVTVDTIPAGGLNGGAQTINIGTGGANGVYAFSGLQINSSGGYQLSATTGNGTNGVFAPTNGLSSCKLWLDAADTSSMTLSGGNITTWTDKSGNGNNATGGGAAPSLATNSTFTAGDAGSGQVVRFNGTSTYFGLNLNYITNSPYTIIILEVAATIGSSQNYIIGSEYNGLEQTLHIGYQSDSDFKWGQYADDMDYDPSSGFSFPTPRIWELKMDGSKNETLYLNGTAVDTRTANSLLGPLVNGEIGRAFGNMYNGDIAETIICNTNLSDPQRVGVENYLSNKWLEQLSGTTASSAFFVGGGQTVSGLAFTQQPSTTTAGVDISPVVTVTVTNSSGSGIAGIPVVVALASGAGTLNGTLIQDTSANGIASFNDLNLTVAGQYQLQATIPTIATNDSSVFSIIPAAAVQLVVRPQPPVNVTAGVAFATQPAVAIEDAFGNVVSTLTDTIVASETAGGNISGTVNNSVSTAAVAGVATFSGLYFTNAGTQSITFTDGALTTNSININVAPGALGGSSFTVEQEPSAAAQVGVDFTNQPIVSVTDDYGNPVTNNTPVIATASSGTLLGETTAYTTGGVATFNNLSLTNLGNITLTFTVGSVSQNSTPISVSVGPVSTVVWTVQPGSALAGSPFGRQPVLETADAGGNITTDGLQPTNWVVVHLISGSGLVGNSLVYNVGTAGSNGVITFQNLQINTGGTSNILAADFIGSITDPTNDIPNCILWLDAYDGSTLTSVSNSLAEWADKSGTDNNATNPSVTNLVYCPITNINTSLPNFAYGGQHTVKFSGDNWLNVNLNPLTGNTYTVIAVDVANTNAANGNSYFFGSGYNGVDQTLHMGYRTADTFTFAEYADDLNWVAPVNFTFPTPRLWTGRLDSSGNQNIFLYGILEATRAANNYPGTLTNGAVGVANGGHYNGDLAEIVVYNRDLSDTERETVEQYLTHKWLQNSRGLTVPFTVGGIAPTLSIVPGSSGTVVVTLTGAPNQKYRLFATTNLTLPFSAWTPIGTNTLNGSGQWQLIDTNNYSDKFYRAITP